MSDEAVIDGYCDPAFAKVREVFEKSFTLGEAGAGVAVAIDGEKVVDLWGGWADADRTHAWEQDTIVNTFSTTKGMTATCAHMLVDRGLLDLDAPVATYWPEFAQAGKEKIPVRQLLTHQAGLAAVKPELPRDQRLDWDATTAALAAQAPMWEPGTKNAYHAVTFGYLVGEVVRRIDGRTLGTFFREEIAEPLGADFMIGFGPEHDARCADILIPEGAGEAAMGRGTNTRAWRAAEIPAANGHGTATAIARVYSALSRGGEVDGIKVLSADAIDRAIVHQVPRAADGSESEAQFPFGLGYMLIGKFPGLSTSAMAGSRVFGHPGAGGSIGLADPDKKIGFGYVMSQMQSGMTGGAHGFRLLAAAYDCLG